MCPPPRKAPPARESTRRRRPPVAAGHRPQGDAHPNQSWHANGNQRQDFRLGGAADRAGANCGHSQSFPLLPALFRCACPCFERKFPCYPCSGGSASATRRAFQHGSVELADPDQCDAEAEEGEDSEQPFQRRSVDDEDLEHGPGEEQEASEAERLVR